MVALRDVVVLCLVSAVCWGCSKDERGAFCEADQRALMTVLAEDQRVVTVLRQVDDGAFDGKPLEAADRVDKAARPSMVKVVSLARGVEPRTRWGEARKQEVLALILRRQTLVDGYGEALRSEDLPRVLAEMEKQRDLEKRAVEVERAVRALPEVGSGQCESP
jgi:hypothetical protein